MMDSESYPKLGEDEILVWMGLWHFLEGGLRTKYKTICKCLYNDLVKQGFLISSAMISFFALSSFLCTSALSL